MKMKNKIFAIEAAPEAIPPKPNTAAMIATIKKMTVQRSIIVGFKFKNLVMSYSYLLTKFCAKIPIT